MPKETLDIRSMLATTSARTKEVSGRAKKLRHKPMARASHLGSHHMRRRSDFIRSQYHSGSTPIKKRRPKPSADKHSVKQAKKKADKAAKSELALKMAEAQRQRIARERVNTAKLLKELPGYQLMRDNTIRILRTRRAPIVGRKSYRRMRTAQQLRHIASVVFAHYVTEKPVEVQVGRLARGQLIISSNKNGINNKLSGDLGVDKTETLKAWAQEALKPTKDWGNTSQRVKARLIRHATKYLQRALDDTPIGVATWGREGTHAEVRIGHDFPNITMVRGTRRPCGACASYYKVHHPKVKVNPHTGPVWLTAKALVPTGVDMTSGVSRTNFAQALRQTGDTHSTQVDSSHTIDYDTDSDSD